MENSSLLAMPIDIRAFPLIHNIYKYLSYLLIKIENRLKIPPLGHRKQEDPLILLDFYKLSTLIYVANTFT